MLSEVLFGVLRGWLTAFVGLVVGIVFREPGVVPEILAVPAGAALVFTLQSFMQLSDVIEERPLSLPVAVLFEKLAVAYGFVFVGLGLSYFWASASS
jgi:ABC-type Fe3+-siderophore transport system permease subunit